MKMVIMAAACALLAACGGGDHCDSKPVTVVTVESANGATTVYRFDDGKEVAHLVDLARQYPDAKVSERQEAGGC